MIRKKLVDVVKFGSTSTIPVRSTSEVAATLASDDFSLIAWLRRIYKKFTRFRVYNSDELAETILDSAADCDRVIVDVARRVFVEISKVVDRVVGDLSPDSASRKTASPTFTRSDVDHFFTSDDLAISLEAYGSLLGFAWILARKSRAHRIRQDTWHSNRCENVCGVPTTAHDDRLVSPTTRWTDCHPGPAKSGAASASNLSCSASVS